MADDRVTIAFVMQDPAALGQTAPRVEVAGAAGQSLLQVALAAGINIEHTCGGVGACATCHVWVTGGMELLSAASDEELDRVEQARDVRMNSRLACQAKIVGTNGRITCEVPAWNRNAVKE
jgi:ferredoxin, 2Fe-2S